MRYAIRKLEGNFWVDVLEFDDARQFEPSDAVEVVGGRMASGELPFFGASLFCLIQKLHNGRERRIGEDVSIDRRGSASSVK